LNSFEDIYTDNYKAMHRVAIKMVGNIDEVPDIVQEIFIDFFKKQQMGI